MKQIKSFQINHDTLTEGLYISRTDGDVVTYDLRFVRPNTPPFLETAAMHTIEHLFATYVRSSRFEDNIIYFGPMGCRTGFYLLLAGDYESKDIMPLLIELFQFISDFHGEVPGASAKDCGNYLDMNLPMARYLAKKYLHEVLLNISENQLYYPK